MAGNVELREISKHKCSQGFLTTFVLVQLKVKTFFRITENWLKTKNAVSILSVDTIDGWFISNIVGSQYYIVVSYLLFFVPTLPLKLSLTSHPQSSVTVLNKSYERHVKRTRLWNSHDLYIFTRNQHMIWWHTVWAGWTAFIGVDAMISWIRNILYEVVLTSKDKFSGAQTGTFLMLINVNSSQVAYWLKQVAQKSIEKSNVRLKVISFN